MPVIEQRPERYLRAPRLTAHGSGGATLHAISWEPGGERIIAFAVNAAGQVLEEARGPLTAGIITLTGNGSPRPTDDSGAEMRALDGDTRALVEHEGGISRVVLERDGRRTEVWRARGMAAAPAVKKSGAGTWVAFHHDVDETTRRADVAKWIALRYVDESGSVWEPEAEMLGRDRELRGVEQSFEFPTLLVGAEGAVTLFGRGSHNFWRQNLNAAGFSERIAISDGEWGSRGRRVACCSVVDGGVLVARRDRKGIELERLAPVEGRAPVLRRADVDFTPGAGPSYAPVDRSRDPAARHGRATYFGDLQQHSAHSDGIGSADEAYLRARHGYGDDFVALTDHESFIGKRTGPGEWAYLQAVAEQHDEPGRFATMISYEWTGRRYPGPGHKCVYYPSPGLPLISRDDVPEGKDLVQAVKALGGVAAPHHIGWTGCDEPGADPVGQPVWEIVSCHGCFEYADHPLGQRGDHRDQLADVMLKKGHRFGFTGGSDSHGLLWHHGESRKRDPFRTGLTAVQTRELSRGAILEALRERRCYATSGVKILLDFSVAGTPMGGEVEGDALLARAEVIGVSDIARLELVGPGGVLASVVGDGEYATLEHPAGGPWVYARAVQADGEMAWASPIFWGSPVL